MNLEKLKDPIPLTDVELRVGNVAKGKGFFLLAYKTARIDANRLDEVCGVGYWQNQHYVDTKGNIVCKIGIWNEVTNQWIWKEDVGTESNTEAEKGSYSDAFKRAGFKWGIGRELYSMPKIFIKWNEWTETKMSNGTVKSQPSNVYPDRWELRKNISDGGYYIVDERGEVLWEQIRGSNSDLKKPAPKSAPKKEPKEEPKQEISNDVSAIKKEVVEKANELVKKGVVGFETSARATSYIKTLKKSPEPTYEEWLVIKGKIEEILNGK